MRNSLLISMIVFVLFTGYILFLTWKVEPLPASQDTEQSTRSFEMLSVVLGLLAGGCMAGYFSFDYSKVNVRHRKVALFISWLFVSSIYLLLALIMYSVRRAGALQIVDGWARAVLFLAAYAFFDGLLLFERWKMGQFRESEE
jgi:FtsH-binding integral membrane protein